MKVIPNEQCVTQHKLLVCDSRIVKSENLGKKFVPKQCIWKPNLCDKFCETLTGEINDTLGEQVDNIYFLLQKRLVGGQRHIEKTNLVVE